MSSKARFLFPDTPLETTAMVIPLSFPLTLAVPFLLTYVSLYECPFPLMENPFVAASLILYVVKLREVKRKQANARDVGSTE